MILLSLVFCDLTWFNLHREGHSIKNSNPPQDNNMLERKKKEKADSATVVPFNPRSKNVKYNYEGLTHPQRAAEDEETYCTANDFGWSTIAKKKGSQQSTQNAWLFKQTYRPTRYHSVIFMYTFKPSQIQASRCTHPPTQAHTQAHLPHTHTRAHTEFFRSPVTDLIELHTQRTPLLLVFFQFSA